VPKNTPAKGKARVKITAKGKKISYGQSGKAKDGGSRVKAGTPKGDSYCARSLGIKKVCLKINRMILTLLIIYHASAGNVLVLNLGENRMPMGIGTYGTKVGRPPAKKKPVKKKKVKK
tara:strand:- start:282 stop:635 length:354 start_codon:yes stop_codon:yes gene_type:complete